MKQFIEVYEYSRGGGPTQSRSGALIRDIQIEDKIYIATRLIASFRQVVLRDGGMMKGVIGGGEREVKGEQLKEWFWAETSAGKKYLCKKDEVMRAGQ